MADKRYPNLHDLAVKLYRLYASWWHGLIISRLEGASTHELTRLKRSNRVPPPFAGSPGPEKQLRQLAVSEPRAVSSEELYKYIIHIVHANYIQIIY